MRAELEKVVKAVEAFYAGEGVLFDKDLGERTLTHRMAVHLEKQFDGWEVDCDYNRLGERLLKLPHGTIEKSAAPRLFQRPAMRMFVCTAPGRSTINTGRPVGGAGGLAGDAAVALTRHGASASSARSAAFAGETSPTMTSELPRGAMCCAWYVRSGPAPIRRTASGVGNPRP